MCLCIEAVWLNVIQKQFNQSVDGSAMGTDTGKIFDARKADGKEITWEEEGFCLYSFQRSAV